MDDRHASERDQAGGLSKRTAAAVVHGQVRQAILTGKIKPGEWLRQEELAASLSVSRMPVREALHLLTEEGLVEFWPHRGARAAPLSNEELEEIYVVRLGLEGLAARYAALKIGAETLDALRVALPRLTTLCTSGDVDAYLREDRLFVERCYAAAERPRLCRQIASLRERAERYLQLVFESGERLQWLDYSYRLFQACAAHDPDAAEEAAQGALRWTLAQATPLIRSYLAELNPQGDTRVDK
ncbi:MAG: GntR family transcriptional regulator [Chloroflexi bacterium]|nr:GntR family transcriptional regulator [Chloroflexota bacterium]